MSKKSYEQRAAEADAASRAALKQLAQEQRDGEALAAAREALAGVRGAADVERLGDVAELKAMRERVVGSLPASRKMAVRISDQLANPRVPGPPPAPADDELRLAIERAGSNGVLPASVLGRLSDGQVREMKAGDGAATYWRSMRQLADDSERPFAVVQS